MSQRPSPVSLPSDVRRGLTAFLAALAPALLATLLCLALYAATAAQGLTWAHDGADGGDLIAACASGGVPHPSGYPTYCLLARALSWLPVGNLAHRYALLSALYAALSVGLLADLLRRLLLARGFGRLLAGATAFLCALPWGLGSALWSQAVIAEVYALHGLCAVALLWLALRLDDHSRGRAWFALGLAAGLGLGNHLTLVLLWPGLLMWLWPLLRRRRVLAAAGGLCLGLCSYLYLPLAAHGGSPVLWGDLRDPAGLLWLVSGRLYRQYVMATPLTMWASRLADLAGRALQQFTVPGLAILLYGITTAGSADRRLLRSTMLMALLPAIYALGYGTTDSYIYLLPVWLIGSVWLALGVHSAWQALGSRGLRHGLAALLGLCAVWLGVGGWRTQDLHTDRAAEDWLAAVEQQAPQGAMLITGQDAHTFALDYLQWALGERTDLVVIDGELWRFSWYRDLQRVRHPELWLPQTADLTVLVTARLERAPVYLADPRPALEAGFVSTKAGVLWELRPIDQ